MVKDFDPGEKSVDAVNEQLESADDEERERILSAELAGKRRKTILEPAGVDSDERREGTRRLNPWEVEPKDQAGPAGDNFGGTANLAGGPVERDVSSTADDQGGVTPADTGTPSVSDDANA